MSRSQMHTLEMTKGTVSTLQLSAHWQLNTGAAQECANVKLSPEKMESNLQPDCYLIIFHQIFLPFLRNRQTGKKCFLGVVLDLLCWYESSRFAALCSEVT